MLANNRPSRPGAAQDQDALLLDKLPRTSPVVAVTAHLLLRGFVLPGGWQGLACLSPEPAARLRPPPVEAHDGPLEAPISSRR